MTQTQTQGAGFSIGVGNWLWGGLCALVAGGLMTVRDGEPGAAGMAGMLVGAAIATYGIAGLIAWIAWRSGRRKPGGGRIAFAVTSLLLMLGQFGPFAQLAMENEALSALKEPQQRFSAKLMQTIADPEFASRDVPAKVKELDAAFADGSMPAGAHRAPALIDAMRAQMHSVAEHELAYAGSLGDFLHANVLEFSSLTPGDELKRRRVACKNLIAATNEYETWTQGNLDAFKARIAGAHVSLRLERSLIDGARSVQTERKPVLDPLLKMRKGYAAALIELFDELAEHDTAWRVGADGKLVFTTDAELESFQTRARKVDSMTEAMGKLEEQMQKAVHLPAAAPQPARQQKL